ncbi:MAG TPA: glycosyltransferase family 4 protein, partial [Thermoanaerobaculia bacterium]|nr:glycosyltransferase family 4 protein [Thermoanaerobaculia bacterium]
MRVLFVAWNFPPRLGGAENLAASLAAALAEEHEVTVLTGAGPAHPGRARVRRAPLPGFLGFLLWMPPALLLRGLRGRPDAVLVLGAPFAGIALAVSRLARRRQVAMVLGSDLVYGGALYRAWLRLTLPRQDRVLAISGHVAGLAREVGVAAERLAVVPPGVDPALAGAPADPTSLPAAAGPVILFVGRVVPRKGLAPFVRHALPRVLARVPDAELWVVGGEPTDSLAHATGELDRLRRELSAGPLADRVRLLGRVPQAALVAALGRAAVLVLPALAESGDVEGFGIVFLEAALFGVPGVA